MVVSAFIVKGSQKPSSDSLGSSGSPVSSSASPVAVAPKKPFYVGVTYCGNSSSEAEQLIDKVKGYTNLFVIQSGPLMSNLTKMEQICDYAVNNASLNIIVYYAHNGDAANTCDQFLSIAQSRWGSHFLGLYYNDEPGGRMLDSSVVLYDSTTGISYNKGPQGYLQESYEKQFDNITTQYTYNYYPSGEILVDIQQIDFSSPNYNSTDYFSNGTIVFSSSNLYGQMQPPALWYYPNGVVQAQNGTVVTDAGNISQFELYQQLLDSKPLQTPDEVAHVYESTEQNLLSTIGNQSDVPLFTSDYGLYRYDYLGGYNVVLAQLGWGQPFMQDIDLVRGAADMQGKSWGTMITWASLTPPSLLNSDQMYDAMRQSYESGAEYVVIFNYNQTVPTQGGNGTSSTNTLLGERQFGAIQRFWNDVVENQSETNNVTAQDALVLPSNYGGGMRNQNDNMWGIWPSDNTSQQVWGSLQASLSKYGSKLDVVFDDVAYPVAERYQQVTYWNQTS